MASPSTTNLIRGVVYISIGIWAFVIDYYSNDRHGNIRSWWDRVFPDLFMHISFWPLILVLDLGGLILERKRRRKIQK
jgi:hypothetical protein